MAAQEQRCAADQNPRIRTPSETGQCTRGEQQDQQPPQITHSRRQCISIASVEPKRISDAWQTAAIELAGKTFYTWAILATIVVCFKSARFRESYT
jgi:hypothetical protein